MQYFFNYTFRRLQEAVINVNSLGRLLVAHPKTYHSNMKPLKIPQTILRSLFWLWLFFILILMIIPANGVSLYDFPGRDKLIHFGLFAILGFFYIVPRFKNGAPFRISKDNWDTYILLFFSVSIEFLHSLITYRSFELMDSLANGFGLISGIIIGRLFMLRFFKS
jgi:hypothetical protein